VTRLPRGLTLTPKGWRITIKRKGQPTYTKRFPRATPQEEVERQLLKARDRIGAGRRAVTSGTLVSDALRYLTDYFKGRAGYAERERHLALWCEALGPHTWRSQITRDDVSRVLQGWRAAGLHPETCNKRRAALLAFWNALDGKSATNPVREVPKFRVDAPLPRALTYAQITKAFRTMRKSKTRARLKVMAYTGARPIQVRAMVPDDWDEQRRTLLLRSTAKGRGTKPHLVPLSDQAQAALREFEDTDAWGAFASAPMARMWKAAVKAAKLPLGAVPYDLRHSFGTQLYRSTGDLRAVKELMGHSSLTMSERYTLAAVPERSAAAVATAFPPRQRKSPPQSPPAPKRSGKRHVA
jgi:integrase/recombinase XerC